jgi:hypothetical protein
MYVYIYKVHIYNIYIYIIYIYIYIYNMYMYVYIFPRTCCREMIIGGTNLSDLMPALNSGYPTEFCMHRCAQRQYCQNLCICTSCILYAHRGAQRQNLCICTSCISRSTSRFFTCFTGTQAQKLTLRTSACIVPAASYIYIYICMQRMLTYADVCAPLACIVPAASYIYIYISVCSVC